MERRRKGEAVVYDGEKDDTENGVLIHERGETSHELQDVRSSLDTAEMERRRKGKAVVYDGEKDDTETGVLIQERGETSYVGVGGGSSEQRINIEELLSGQEAHQHKQQTDSVYKESLLTSRNIVALVVIFMATVGWSTGLNPPGGLNDDGEAAVGKKTAFFIFMLAVYTMVPVSLITLGLLCGVTPRNQKVQRNTLKVCHAFMWIGLISFAVAFVSGSWLIVPSDRFWLKLIGLLNTLAAMIVLISYIWSKQARKFFRRLSFCDLDGSSDEDEQARKFFRRLSFCDLDGSSDEAEVETSMVATHIET
ncbi:PREDICTED: uncharacterized protein LOC104767525 [Camelina sativa]|uniref:Uncharacterized protein LOC104767525 n=1 Tax=Camelina sativa TaxID=90675 RepID=A0ABM1RBI7_CAMSA|nr:PREDICTED: uncharacterized protein LOC104767525 [Camelina sativa]